jgi:hypothetical protein
LAGVGEPDKCDRVGGTIQTSPEGDADQVFGARTDDGVDTVESCVDDLDSFRLEPAFAESVVPSTKCALDVIVVRSGEQSCPSGLADEDADGPADLCCGGRRRLPAGY